MIAIFLSSILRVYGKPPCAARMLPCSAFWARPFTNPVWTSAILRSEDFATALAGFLLLASWKMPPWIVVVLLAATGVAFAVEL